MRKRLLQICFLAITAFAATAEETTPPGLPFQAVDPPIQAKNRPPLPPVQDIQKQVDQAAKAGGAAQTATKTGSFEDGANRSPSQALVSAGSAGDAAARQSIPPPTKPATGKRPVPPVKAPLPDAKAVQGMADWMSSRRGKPPAEEAPRPTPAGDGVIRAKQGKSYTLAIARGQLNRIVTPFADPKVLTVSAIETKVEGSSVYVATDSTASANLFITDNDGTDAISLELAPADGVRPAEVRVEVEKGAAAGGTPAGDKKDGRGDHPYVAEVKQMLRALALGSVPQGFTLGDPAPLRQAEVCAMPGVAFQPGQMMAGTRVNLLVYVAVNTGDDTVNFDESACAARDVMAVAAWPKFRLAPGEKTEIYVAVRAPAGAEAAQPRPSLLGQ